MTISYGDSIKLKQTGVTTLPLYHQCNQQFPKETEIRTAWLNQPNYQYGEYVKLLNRYQPFIKQ